MMGAIKEFIGSLLILGEVVLFILIIGIAGGIDQNMLTISEGLKRIGILAAVMAVTAAGIYFMVRNEDRSKEDIWISK